MKLKKGILLTTLTLIIVTIISAFGSVQAATTSKIVTNRTFNLTPMGYTVGEKTVYRIYDTGNDNKTLYCIKAGPGFGSGDMGNSGNSKVPTSYTNGTATDGTFGDLRYRNNIASKYRSALPQNTDNYEALLWILDQCYVPAKDNNDRERAEENKRILLEAVEQYVSQYENENSSNPKYTLKDLSLDPNTKLTEYIKESDIKLVQQLAIWHYTNTEAAYHFDNMPEFIADSTADGPLRDEYDPDTARIRACNALFDYLVQTPKESRFSYDYTQTGDRSQPVEFANTTLKITTSGNRKIVGPYKINELRDDITYTLDATIIDGNNRTITDVKYVNSTGTEIGTNLKDLVDRNFYISIPSTVDTSDIEFSISGSFMVTTLTYWGETNIDTSSSTAQPVVQVEKEEVEFEDYRNVGETPKPDELEFDLALRKFISGVEDSNSKTRPMISREPKVDTTPLLNGTDTTAIYNHTKDPVGVSNGDIVTYTIRVYNEGQIDGYITEITDHLPKQLEFIVDDELNAKYGWKVSADGRTVTTDITSPETKNWASRDSIYENRNTGSDTDKVLLKAFARTKDAKLDYIDVKIRCRVKENIDLYEKITNIADITGFTDSEGNIVTDRDSQKSNVTLPNDSTLPTYKDAEIESGIKYIKGQQDDDDFEKLVLQRFDLALRKFITGVISGDKTTDITNRVPVFKKVSNKEFKYEHPKDPVEVANGNTVIYTLRIFNEGNVAGYAKKVKDDLPDGLEFLPENSINTAFGWKMYKEDGTETKDVKEAKYIETDFLSKEKEKEAGDNLIDSFDPETMSMPDYKDLKIAFKVTEPNTSDRIIINQAQISDDSDEDGNPIEDVDSEPNKWNEGEDDQDIEKIKVKYFDLSLKKWVTESIVTVDGKKIVTKSGHTGDENPEAPMKVEIQTGKINKTTVKFRFNIKVTNEGEIAGYATELIDYIPDGLKFVAEDNPKWKVSEDGKVTTDQLKDKLLQPGESATVDIVLTWINGKDNMGEKVNWAEISKDKNEFNSPDIDSTPGNYVKGEDDIDQAPVLLSPATGSIETYIGLTLMCVVTFAGGVLLIKKFVI